MCPASLAQEDKMKDLWDKPFISLFFVYSIQLWATQ